mgnify:CR=1 FL=1
MQEMPQRRTMWSRIVRMIMVGFKKALAVELIGIISYLLLFNRNVGLPVQLRFYALTLITWVF